MKKKLLTMLLCLLLTIALAACGGNENDGASVSNEATEEQQADETEEETAPENLICKIGESWEVEGQWKLTINSVTATDERNEFDEHEPGAVYIINYTYENIGYEDSTGIMNGLYIDLSMGQIVDNSKEMGYSYPGNITFYPQEVPVGANTTAEACIGVNNAGSFTIAFEEYDSNSNSQNVTFQFDVQ